MTRHKESANHHELFDSYAEYLLEPGWAGELGTEEFHFVKSQLKQSASLRRRWGFRPSARRLAEKKIRTIAREGKAADERRVLASAENNKISC